MAAGHSRVNPSGWRALFPNGGTGYGIGGLLAGLGTAIGDPVAGIPAGPCTVLVAAISAANLVAASRLTP